MRATTCSAWGVWLLVVAATASAEEPVVPRVHLALPQIPAAMTGEPRTQLEAMLGLARAEGDVPRLGGPVREPCGLVVRSGDRVAVRARLTWGAHRLLERVQWEDHGDGDPIWRHTQRTWRAGSLEGELRRMMSYRDGEAECPNSVRTTLTRDARGRIARVRTRVSTCEGVDSGTRWARYAWQPRVGFEEAIVTEGRGEEAEQTSRVFVPRERDAWADVGSAAWPAWVDVRDDDGLLRVRVERRDVGLYTYVCDGPEWPRGSTAPDRL